jgi:hypothetical protein
MEFRFEPCVHNLIQKWYEKDPQKREDHLIFINFGIRNFTVGNTNEIKKNFNVWMLQSSRSHGMRGVIFWGWFASR